VTYLVPAGKLFYYALRGQTGTGRLAPMAASLLTIAEESI